MIDKNKRWKRGPIGRLAHLSFEQRLERDKEIRRLRQRQLYAVSPKRKEQIRASYQRNKAARNARRKERYNIDPERKQKARFANLLLNYGITREQYQTLYNAQQGKCAICKNEQRKNARGGILYVDHDHTDGTIRQLLCHDCNLALGYAKENPALLRTMAEYLEGHNAIRQREAA